MCHTDNVHTGKMMDSYNFSCHRQISEGGELRKPLRDRGMSSILDATFSPNRLSLKVLITWGIPIDHIGLADTWDGSLSL